MFETGYPKEEIINVEALRYNYLDLKQHKTNNNKNNTFTILVLGDYDENINYEILAVLE